MSAAVTAPVAAPALEPVAPVALEDRRTGSPAQQMRADLARFRAVGLPFDAAWEKAYQRVKWPHDTQHRREWKAILAGDKAQWRRAYLFEAPARPCEMAASALAPL